MAKRRAVKHSSVLRKLEQEIAFERKKSILLLALAYGYRAKCVGSSFKKTTERYSKLMGWN
jgi:hypothetical protein